MTLILFSLKYKFDHYNVKKKKALNIYSSAIILLKILEFLSLSDREI